MGLIPAVGNTAKTFRKRIKNDKKTLGLCMVVVGSADVEGEGGLEKGKKDANGTPSLSHPPRTTPHPHIVHTDCNTRPA